MIGAEGNMRMMRTLSLKPSRGAMQIVATGQCAPFQSHLPDRIPTQMRQLGCNS
jgi:hypothetical protein